MAKSRNVEMRESNDRGTALISRDIDERKNFERAIMKGHYVSPLNFEEHEIPDGVEYHWFRNSCMGKADLMRIQEAQEKGWSFVPASRHPNKVMMDPTGRIQTVDGIIEIDGAIVMERDKSLCDFEAKVAKERNYKMLMQMPGIENGSAAIPFQVSGRTFATHELTQRQNAASNFGGE